MARQTRTENLLPVISAAQEWITRCLCEDGSLFSKEALWTPALIEEAYHAFADHPDEGDNDFITKLKGQMAPASSSAKKAMSEVLWALLLFPSRMRPRTKRQQIRAIWELSGATLAENSPFLADEVLRGIGSGGPGFNNYRPAELQFLMEAIRSIKALPLQSRKVVFTDYGYFNDWIETVPREGSRQYRHMLRYFAFPDTVERMSSNNDRRKVLDAFGVADEKATKGWSDRQLDAALLNLRGSLQMKHPGESLDFYEAPLREGWIADRKVITPTGEVSVVIPDAEGEEAEGDEAVNDGQPRQSIVMQALLSEIGAIMGFSIWVPPGDRVKVLAQIDKRHHPAFIEKLPLNYDATTLSTIMLIDVLWLNKRSIVRAFEVEHTTAVYSGLLRMADLLALQPNMRINLHIVAADERRDKVFRELRRPVFSVLDAGPLYKTCTYLSYESVNALRSLNALAHTNDSVIGEYEERAGDDGE